MQAAAAEFDEIGTKPVTPKSMAPPWIDLTALFDSLLLRVHVFVCVIRVSMIRVYVCMCAYTSIGWTNRFS